MGRKGGNKEAEQVWDTLVFIARIKKDVEMGKDKKREVSQFFEICLP